MLPTYCGYDTAKLEHWTLFRSSEPRPVRNVRNVSIGDVLGFRRRQCFGDQAAAVVDAVEGDEAAHSGALAGA